MASPRGLSEGKTEPPDYILMVSSANVSGITYKINFGDFCPPFLKKIFESSTKWKRFETFGEPFPAISCSAPKEVHLFPDIKKDFKWLPDAIIHEASNVSSRHNEYQTIC